jgi:hypothetical protein
VVERGTSLRRRHCGFAVCQGPATLLGVVVVTATAVAVVNLIVDIIDAFIDPRVRYA